MTRHHGDMPAFPVPSISRAETARAGKPAGFLEYTLRSTFRDLCRVYGFGGARQIVAEIINDEAERKSA